MPFCRTSSRYTPGSTSREENFTSVPALREAAGHHAGLLLQLQALRRLRRILRARAATTAKQHHCRDCSQKPYA